MERKRQKLVDRDKGSLAANEANEANSNNNNTDKENMQNKQRNAQTNSHRLVPSTLPSWD